MSKQSKKPALTLDKVKFPPLAGPVSQEQLVDFFKKELAQNIHTMTISHTQITVSVDSESATVAGKK